MDGVTPRQMERTGAAEGFRWDGDSADAVDKVLAIGGVAELLKPTIDALRAKLAVLSA